MKNFDKIQQFLNDNPDFSDVFSYAVSVFDNVAYKDMNTEKFQHAISLLEDFRDLLD